MNQTFGKTLAGIAVWALVAVLAMVSAHYWDPLWGFFPVLGAVLVAWAVGEWVTRRELSAGGER